MERKADRIFFWGILVYFDDGTNPTMEMCREFIDLSDKIISAGGELSHLFSLTLEGKAHVCVV